FSGGGIDGNQVVVVEINAPSADFAQHRSDIVGGKCRSHGIAEGIATAVAQGPQSKCEFMFGLGLIRFVHLTFRFCRHSISPPMDSKPVVKMRSSRPGCLLLFCVTPELCAVLSLPPPVSRRLDKGAPVGSGRRAG